MSQPQPVNFPNAIAGQLHIDATDTTRFGVYSTGTVRKFILGTRYRIGDRVYKFGRGGAAIVPRYGAKNFGASNNITGGVVSARSIGDTWIDILLDGTTGASGWFGTKNNMVGGMVVMATGDPEMMRHITGHEKGATGATIKVYLDGPLIRATDATQMLEVIQNPYFNLRQTNNNFTSVMGLPTAKVASESFGWMQTWGGCWIVPALPVADTAQWREVYFGGDGSILGSEDSTAETGLQRAGFVIDNTSPGSDNPPFIFLQISPF